MLRIRFIIAHKDPVSRELTATTIEEAYSPGTVYHLGKDVAILRTDILDG